jgi:hypothetical protein
MREFPAGNFPAKNGNRKSVRENTSTDSALGFAGFSRFFPFSCFSCENDIWMGNAVYGAGRDGIFPFPLSSLPKWLQPGEAGRAVEERLVEKGQGTREEWRRRGKRKKLERKNEKGKTNCFVITYSLIIFISNEITYLLV